MTEAELLKARVLHEVIANPGWDIENLADALGESLADVARAVDVLLRSGRLAEFPST